MTERWISTKKYYCKYCNTWIPDTKLGRQQHEISDRHKNAMSREVRRIQREEAIKRHSDPALTASQAMRGTASSGAELRNSKSVTTNTSAYGYGEDADVAAYIAREKRKFRPEDIPTMTEGVQGAAAVPVGTREGIIGKWTVTQVISKKEEVADDVKTEGEVKVEEFKATGEERGKRERAPTPDEEDLMRFKVQEKVYPADIKDEEDVKVPIVGFKKRKIGAKSSRVSGTL
jgi:hypothetical protein